MFNSLRAYVVVCDCVHVYGCVLVFVNDSVMQIIANLSVRRQQWCGVANRLTAASLSQCTVHRHARTVHSTFRSLQPLLLMCRTMTFSSRT